MNYDEYVEYADKIPSMGGRQIKKYIFEAVKDLKDGYSVVELGTWLGAATAQIALALMCYGKSNPIYSYDKFIVSGRQPLKAKKEGWKIDKRDVIYDRVKKHLSVFPTDITLVKGMITDQEYDKEPIGLYIDDALKQEERFLKGLKIFGKKFVPGETVMILMDYYLWQKWDDEKYKFQYKYMNANKDKFELLVDNIDSTYNPTEGKEGGAIFRYKGGLS